MTPRRERIVGLEWIAYSDRLEEKKTSVLRSRYSVFDRGRQIAVLDGSMWTGGSGFTLGETGSALAWADQVGRKQWTVTPAVRHHFRRKSLLGQEEKLILGGTRVGSVRKTSFLRGDVIAELPGLPEAVQLFVLGVVISKWDAQILAAGAAGS